MDIDGIYYCSRCMRKVEDDTQVCPHCGYDPANITINSQHLTEGTFLNNRYLLGAVIGAGGFGVTYAAWDENLSVPVAIKEYFPVKYAYRNIEESDELLPHEESRGLFALGLSRFRKEAQVLAQFQNVPGIVNINECFDENETAYIAMEFVHGVPLDKYVQEHKPSPKKLLDIMLPAINALEIIHRQGINHRDIKPENLLVQEDGSIKLIDFGSAREVEHVTNLIVVSDGYAPLEQYDLKQPQGPWGDVYGISATIYHMLTGVMPEASISRAKNDTLKSPSKLGVKLKQYQEKALMAGLTVDPQKRIQSIAEFRAMLYNMPLPEEVRRRKAFVRRFIAVAVLTVLLMAATVVNFAVGFPLGEGLLYSLYPDGWHVVGVAEERAEVTVPGNRLGLPVPVIEEGAFRGNQMLESVQIADGVKSINDSAFAFCNVLTKIGFSNSITDIHDRAFAYCVSLNTISLPSDLISIGDEAFLCCYELRKVDIMSNSPFVPIMNSTAETLPPVQLPPVQTADGSIGIRAFYKCESLVSFSLPKDIVSIGNYAFSDCTALEDLWIDYATTIGDYAFSNCTALDTLWINNATTIGDYAFSNCTALENIRSDSVTALGDYAFSNCSALRDISIASVTTIGNYAFSNCSSLWDISIDSVTTIGDGAFFDCERLWNLSIPNGVTLIENDTFSGCSSLRNITIPDSITRIKSGAFFNCAALESISLPNSVIWLGDSAFAYCGSLCSFTIPDSVTVIGDHTFSRCPELTNVSIPDSVTSIGSCAFFECTSLSNISIPNSVTSIDDRAFYGCSSLKSITIPGSVSNIGSLAFSTCTSLVSAEISDGVTNIEDCAFLFCGALKSVSLPASVTSICHSTFLSCHPSLIIQVERDSYAAQYCEDNTLQYVYTDELSEAQ